MKFSRKKYNLASHLVKMGTDRKALDADPENDAIPTGFGSTTLHFREKNANEVHSSSEEPSINIINQLRF